MCLNVLEIRKFSREFYFLRNFVHAKFCEIKKPSQNGKITMSFADIRILCQSRGFVTSQICLLMLFAKKNVAKISELRIVQWLFLHNRASKSRRSF